MEALLQKEYPRLEALYRHLHSHPELSGKEDKTSAKVAAELEESGLEVSRGVGGTGVVAILPNGKGPTVLIRSDMDALPLTERTGLPYASREAGVTHACGHDIHMTCMVGTARLLKQKMNDWKGTTVFVAQPAEEKGQGAQAMIEAGLFTHFPRPDYALALHVDSQLATGTIGYVSGYAFANVDSVDVVIHGRGGHGAYPHLAVDPIVIAAEVVGALQTIVSRELNPHETTVVTVGSIHGGTKHNIIPDQVKMELTVRSYTEGARSQLLAAIQRITTAVARAHQAPQDPEIEVTESIPSTYNDPQLTRRLVEVFRKNFTDAHVIEKDPEMGGEDFGLFGRAGIPAFLFRVGSIDPRRFQESRRPGGKPLPSLHSAEYLPDFQATITLGVRAMTVAALDLLSSSG